MKKIKFINLSNFFIILSLFLTPIFVNAANDIVPIQNVKTLTELINTIYTYFTTITTTIIVICFIIAGIMYATAGGDTNRIKSAKSWLMNAIIGVAIILGFNFIVLIIRNILTKGVTQP